MLGRGAIRNPWLFDQIRQHFKGQPVFQPSKTDKLAYVEELYDTVTLPNTREIDQVNRLKKHLNFFGPDMSDTAGFLNEMRRCTTRMGLRDVCTRYFEA
jgi:tRNA-dihydrouridine synthase